MAEPTVQVPVSLIEQARDVVESEVDETWIFRAQSALRALLSQPTPTAEPRLMDLEADDVAVATVFDAYPEGRYGGPSVQSEILRHARPTEPPRVEYMASGKTEEAIRADEREQWASYFDNTNASVGSPPLTYARVVKMLRGTKPFGVAQGSPFTIRDVVAPS